MARGRSLVWLACILLGVAGLSFTANWYETGPASFQQAWRTLVAGAAVAIALFLIFRILAKLLQAKKPDAARSLVHIQTVATAVVAILATAAIAGGFQSAIVGLGLVGFGVTLALQRPILAVAGWASLVLGGSVRVGDRITVGDMTGDVLDITLFQTKLWEVGGANSNTPGRPTGRLLATTNAIFLEKAVSNATSDTPVVFDEFVVNVAFEANLSLAKQLLEEVSSQVLDASKHEQMARTYRRLTKGLAMEAHFPEKPVILMESKPSWMEFRLRYLVDARRAGRVQSQLTNAWTNVCEPHGEEIPPIYNRSQSMAITGAGRPLNP